MQTKLLCHEMSQNSTVFSVSYYRDCNFHQITPIIFQPTNGLEMHVRNRFVVSNVFVMEASVIQDDNEENLAKKICPHFHGWNPKVRSLMHGIHTLVMKLNSFRCFDWSSSLYS